MLAPASPFSLLQPRLRNATPPPAIRGSVVDELTRAPVAAALVQIIVTNRPLAGTSTDGNGRFLLPTPGGGEYRVQVTRIG